MTRQDEYKRLAGRRGAEEVQDGMLVGLGTGSTVRHTIERLGERVRDEALSVRGVPTSLASERLALDVGLSLAPLEEDTRPDVTIDGADEIDHRFHMIKGGGGALLREKVVARRSRRLVIVVDSGKRVERLGQKFALPVEVVPFAWRVVKADLADLGGEPRLRMNGDEPYLTDNHNHILDTKFTWIEDPAGLHQRINEIPGVVDNGLFVGMADLLVVGGPDGVELLRPGA